MWCPPPQILTLPRQEVHLWQCALALDPEKMNVLWQILDIEERKRADRFYLEKHRRRFIVARAVLKGLIAQYLQISAASVKFILGDRGKPALDPSIAGLQFNLSHSHEYALYGFVCDRQIGVDLEHLRPIKDAVDLAQRFFCPREYQAIAQLPDDNQQAIAFLRYWTAKEAFLKGIGAGIAGGLDQVEMIFSLDRTASLYFADPLHKPIQPWQVSMVDFGSEYLCAAAIEGSPLCCQFWQVNCLELSALQKKLKISFNYLND
jgi:4'-phosphopantetheinyl transferase